jgi:hypothetical protein
MRECAICHTQTDDHVVVCPKCGADLTVDSIVARALKSIMSNPRTQAVYVVAADYACPICRRAQGTYPKKSGAVPRLPLEGCSCPDGCTCRYEPLVIEVGP